MKMRPSANSTKFVRATTVGPAATKAAHNTTIQSATVQPPTVLSSCFPLLSVCLPVVSITATSWLPISPPRCPPTPTLTLRTSETALPGHRRAHHNTPAPTAKNHTACPARGTPPPAPRRAPAPTAPPPPASASASALATLPPSAPPLSSPTLPPPAGAKAPPTRTAAHRPPHPPRPPASAPGRWCTSPRGHTRTSRTCGRCTRRQARRRARPAGRHTCSCGSPRRLRERRRGGGRPRRRWRVPPPPPPGWRPPPIGPPTTPSAGGP